VRIAILGTRGVPARYGGFETAAEEVGRRLAEWGHEVVVYCRNPGQTQRTYNDMQLVNLPSIRTQAFETFSHTGLSVAHAIARTRPDVAFLFNAANAPFVPILRAAGIPVAIHVDGLEWKRAKWGRHASAYYRWAEERSTRWAQAVIADSEGIVDYLFDAHGIVATYIAYGAPTPLSNPLRLAELGVRARAYHLTVARFEPENHVAEIVAGYVSSSCRLPLVVVGDAAYGDRYRRAVFDAAGSDDRVRFVGSIWDQQLLDALYGAAASYLHGHSVGGTNPSLLRAMGLGAPVIANDVPFNREVALQNGRYFRTPADLARLCEEVEADPARAMARGDAGRGDITCRYRWDDVAASYEKLAHHLYIAAMTGERVPGERWHALPRRRLPAEEPIDLRSPAPAVSVINRDRRHR
jgi:glycosyltransferase involved in cell wall biosynthesis